MSESASSIVVGIYRKIDGLITEAASFWANKNEKGISGGDKAKVLAGAAFWPITFPVWLISQAIQRSNAPDVSERKPMVETIEETTLVVEGEGPVIVDPPPPDPTFSFAPSEEPKAFEIEFRTTTGTLYGDFDTIRLKIESNPAHSAHFIITNYEVEDANNASLAVRWKGEPFKVENKENSRTMIDIPLAFWEPREMMDIKVKIRGIMEPVERYLDSPEPAPASLTFSYITDSF